MFLQSVKRCSSSLDRWGLLQIAETEIRPGSRDEKTRQRRTLPVIAHIVSEELKTQCGQEINNMEGGDDEESLSATWNQKVDGFTLTACPKWGVLFLLFHSSLPIWTFHLLKKDAWSKRGGWVIKRIFVWFWLCTVLSKVCVCVVKQNTVCQDVTLLHLTSPRFIQLSVTMETPGGRLTPGHPQPNGGSRHQPGEHRS